MDQQVNTSSNIKITTVLVVLLIVAISAIPAFHFGVASTTPQLESLRLDAGVARLNLQEREGVIDRLEKKISKDHRTIDSCHAEISVAGDTILALRGRLSVNESIVLNQRNTINDKEQEIAALMEKVAEQNNDLLCQDETITSLRKGLKLSVNRLNNAAILNAGLQDSVLLLLPDAVETNRLRQNSAFLTFSSLLFLVILLIVVYGVWRGWFVKRTARKNQSNKTLAPGRSTHAEEKTSSVFRLSANLFRARPPMGNDNSEGQEKRA